MEHELIVRSEATADVWPDRAVLGIAVEGEGRDRDAAYAEAAAVSKRVDDVVAQSRDRIKRATTTSLVVQPKGQWKKGEMKHTGWRAARSSSLEVASFDRLGELVAALAEAGASITTGPSFSVDPENAAYGDLRRAAAANARRRADDYAAGFGLRIVAVAGVSEQGVDTIVPMSRGAMLRGASYAGEPAVIAIDPEPIAITATVEARFTFEPL